MDMVYETERKITMAFCSNELIKYLEGVGIYEINSNLRDVTSLHAFNFSMECYGNTAQMRQSALYNRCRIKTVDNL